MSSPKGKRRSFRAFFFCIFPADFWLGCPSLSSEDNPPGLRSVVHPTSPPPSCSAGPHQSQRQSPVRRGGGVRRDDRSSSSNVVQRRREYRYLFIFFSIAHPYIYPLVPFCGLFVVGAIYTQCVCVCVVRTRVCEKNNTHTRSIDRVRWSLRWLAHTWRRLPRYLRKYFFLSLKLFFLFFDSTDLQPAGLLTSTVCSFTHMSSIQKNFRVVVVYSY